MTRGSRAKSVEYLLERSSLGTPEAKRLRAKAPEATVARVLARVDELQAKGKETAHVHGGNCWEWIQDPSAEDVCLEHEEPRGDCSVCPPCPACDADFGVTRT